MAILLINLPLLAVILAWLIEDDALRARLLPITGALHIALTLAGLRYWVWKPDAWFRLDPLGGWVLLVVSVLFTLCAFYAPVYLALRPGRDHKVFSVCFLATLAMASLTCAARHPAVLWVGIESLTLVTTPLLYFNHNKRSLEATWKYLVICSVGMALALLGTFFVAYAAQSSGMGDPLYFDRLTALAPRMPAPWLRAGFVLLLVGYGTKMGLAPLHAWKPDAYSETPGIVGTMLAGGVTSCAFLALLRMFAILVAAGEGAFARQLLVAMGLLSMGWAFVFMIRQGDLRRLLAYSSVEHMGILAFAVGIGGGATRFALLHVAANALVKCVLFLAGGNIVRAFATHELSELTGAIRRVPVSGWLLFLGLVAVTCSPPFAPFVSVFGITGATFGGGHPWLGAAFLTLLFGIFMAMGATVLPVVQGVPHRNRARTPYGDTFGTTAPVLVALGLALLLGLWMPRGLESLLGRAAQLVEGGAP
jgi:hydrogenase-4 component F